jgi:hypothetical protein
MKKLLLSVFTLNVLCFSACDLLDDSPCGPKKTYDLYLLGSNIIDTAGGQFNHYMEGSNSVFQWGNIIEHVCTDEHVKTEFKAALFVAKDAPSIKARGRVSWQFLYEKEYPLQLKEDDFIGSGETGLKSAFPDLNGWFIPTIEVYFPTLGSYSADTAFIKKNVISVNIISKYREYK